MKTIHVRSQKNSDQSATVTTEAGNWGELLETLESNGINTENVKGVVKETKQELSNPIARLPEQEEFTLYLVTGSKVDSAI